MPTEFVIPERLRHLPLDRRGLPISFVTWVDSEGTPDFTITDQAKRDHVLTNQLCGICGKPHEYWKWFVGGPKCEEEKLFIDPPMHEECARFSATACPFLNNPKVGFSKKPVPKHGAELGFASEHRPERMYLMSTRNYKCVWYKGAMLAKAGTWATVELIEASVKT